MGSNMLKQGTSLSLRKILGILILLLMVGAVAGKPALEKFLKNYTQDNSFTVYFPRGLNMAGDAGLTLDEVEYFMRENTLAHAEITGYTNPRGDEQANLDLSRQRAEQVERELSSRGVDQSRMSVEGMGGGGPPLARLPGETDAAWQLRMGRVEIRLKLF